MKEGRWVEIELREIASLLKMHRNSLSEYIYHLSNWRYSFSYYDVKKNVFSYYGSEFSNRIYIQLSMIIICSTSIQIMKSCFENLIQHAVTKVFGKEFSLDTHINDFANRSWVVDLLMQMLTFWYITPCSQHCSIE